MEWKILTILDDIYVNHLWVVKLAIILQIALSIIAGLMLAISGMFIMALIGIVLILVTIFSSIYVMAAIEQLGWNDPCRLYGND